MKTETRGWLLTVLAIAIVVGPATARAQEPANAETRAATGRNAGDEVEVRLELDLAPRTVEPPAALRAALDDDAEAAAAWQSLSPSKQKEHARSVESAKADETRARRILKVMESLRG